MRRERLIAARKAIGKNQEDIAEAVGVDRTTLGKWERGDSTPVPGQRQKYADALRVSLADLSIMIGGSLPGADEDMPTWMSTYLGMEQSASEIRAYEPRAVIGLLQTPEYIRHIASAVSSAQPDTVRRTIETRVHRQKRVVSGELELDVIQPEASLRLRVGPPEVMSAQLYSMVELSERSNIKIRVTTFDMGSYQARRVGQFYVMTHPWGRPRVHIEDFTGGRFLTDTEEVAYFGQAYDDAVRIALSPSESRKYIAALAAEWSKRE